MQRGAIILCGGQSRRMGQPKALLPFGAETLLTRVLRLLSEVVALRIVVAASDQPLPDMPADVRIARDRDPDRGPLEGMRAGLEAGATGAELFYVSSCDTPLLRPAWVRGLFELWQPGDDAVVPRGADYYHPLSAVYHRRVLPEIVELLAHDQRRPLCLLQRVRTREVPVDQLRVYDAELHSLCNVNRPEDYQAALRLAGYGDGATRSVGRC